MRAGDPENTVVVTGAAGWLGQNLLRALAAQPGRRRIRCLVHEAADAAPAEVVDPRIEVVVGDVRDPVVVDELFAGVTAPSVFHSAAVIHPAKAVREFFDVNVGGTQLVLDRARRVGATRFVHVSSNSPFGANPTSEDRFDEDSPFHPYMGYGRSKLEAEQLVQRSYDRGDLATVIVRPPWFYGPFQPARQTQFLAAVRRARFPLVGPGTQRRSMVYTGNLVQGVLLAEVADAAPGNAYWIADAEPYSLADDSPHRARRARGRGAERVEAATDPGAAPRGCGRGESSTRSRRRAVGTCRCCTSSGS